MLFDYFECMFLLVDWEIFIVVLFDMGCVCVVDIWLDSFGVLFVIIYKCCDLKVVN